MEGGFALGSDIKTTWFNEGSGHRLQSDKLVAIQHETNRAITDDLVVADDDPVFAGAYSALVHRNRDVESSTREEQKVPQKAARKRKSKSKTKEAPPQKVDELNQE